MTCAFILLLLLFHVIFIVNIQAFRISFSRIATRRISALQSSVPDNAKSKFVPNANPTDMKHFAFVLANVTDTINEAPEKALSMLAREAGWLLSHNLPKLAELMLSTYPSLRQDHDLMKSYYFVLDFLEAFAKESNEMVKKNQRLLREIIEASKVSEEELDSYFQLNSKNITNPEFLIYLDAEINGRQPDSPMHTFLTSVKLKVLDEHGKLLGIDVHNLPILAIENDPIVIKEKLWEQLQSYSPEAVKIYLDSISIIIQQMKSRFSQHADEQLLDNLEYVQRLAQEYYLTNIAKE